MANLTNHDLHIILVEMRGDIKAIRKEQEDASKWQVAHEKSDTDHFDTLTTQINGMNKFGTAIAIVAASVGASGTWLWNKITS